MVTVEQAASIIAADKQRASLPVSPCPLCGREYSVLEFRPGVHLVRLARGSVHDCLICQACQGWFYGPTPARAAGEWNDFCGSVVSAVCEAYAEALEHGHN